MCIRLLVLAIGLLSFDLVAVAQNNFGQPIATTVQLPTFGISFDADGVLQMKTVTDPTGRLMRERLAAARAHLPVAVATPSKSRKVSMVRLEAAINQRLANGQKPTDEMLKLAGLTRVDSIFCFPETGDIVLQGPAQGWMQDLVGRAVAVRTGEPTLLLSDCVVAMRAFQPGAPKEEFVGCTINPTADGLMAFQRFQRRIPKVVSASRRQMVAQSVARGAKESLGLAEVQVFGISNQTHFARVMIEADYRMKRIAIGVEPPPVEIKTFASALASARVDGLQRWWFTPNYDGVKTSPDRLAVELDGQGVQLKTENKTVLRTGEIVDSGFKPSKAMLTYANSFTRKYPEIAAADPVYGQLRQLIDWLIVAAFMRQNDWYQKATWPAKTFFSEESFSVKTASSPIQAPVVVNAFWKGHRMFSPAGGGVSIEPMLALERMEDSYPLRESRLQLRSAIEENRDAERWWWD